MTSLGHNDVRVNPFLGWWTISWTHVCQKSHVIWCWMVRFNYKAHPKKYAQMSYFVVDWKSLVQGQSHNYPSANKVIQKNKGKEIICVHCEIYYHTNKSSNSLCMFYEKWYTGNLRPSLATPQVVITTAGCACEDNVGIMTTLLVASWQFYSGIISRLFSRTFALKQFCVSRHLSIRNHCHTRDH